MDGMKIKKLQNTTRRTRNGLESIVVSINFMFHGPMQSFHDFFLKTEF